MDPRFEGCQLLVEGVEIHISLKVAQEAVYIQAISCKVARFGS
jgi:hypothetical protein